MLPLHGGRQSEEHNSLVDRFVFRTDHENASNRTSTKNLRDFGRWIGVPRLSVGFGVRKSSSSLACLHHCQRFHDFPLFPRGSLRLFRLRHLRSLQSPRLFPHRISFLRNNRGTDSSVRPIIAGGRFEARAEREEANRALEPVAESIRGEAARDRGLPSASVAADLDCGGREAEK